MPACPVPISDAREPESVVKVSLQIRLGFLTPRAEKLVCCLLFMLGPTYACKINPSITAAEYKTLKVTVLRDVFYLGQRNVTQ
jgi:hypothetical protein